MKINVKLEKILKIYLKILNKKKVRNFFKNFFNIFFNIFFIFFKKNKTCYSKSFGYRVYSRKIPQNLRLFMVNQ